jgi:hypothetical protein
VVDGMEKEMFLIIKQYLESLEFTVKAEVNDVDIMAVKDETVLLVEMKSSLNTTLMAQGIKRNKISDTVYLAIPRPSIKVIRSKLFKDKCLILRHLELGLVLVDVKKEQVDVILDPSNYHVKRQKKKRAKLLKEFQMRKTASNIGGVNQTKIVTAYRELALLALDYMKDQERTTKELREYTKRKKIVDILQKNYYGWFERVDRGVYKITVEGQNALHTYDHILRELKDLQQKES